DAWARPGGGQSYSGRSSGSFGGGGGGGGGDSFIIYLLIRLVFSHPIIGIPLLLVVIYVAYTKKHNQLSDWGGASSSTSQGMSPMAGMGQAARPPSLEELRALDPDFSEIVTRDFVYRLYAALHGARGDEKKMAGLRPYITDNARAALETRLPTATRVEGVVIGSMRMLRVTTPPADAGPDGVVELSFRFESNMTVQLEGGGQNSAFVTETWTLSRSATAKSRTPDQVDALGCPNCGAPFESADNRKCDYCGEIVADGRFDWQVSAVHLHDQQFRPPNLGGYAEEVGTFDPLIKDHALDQMWRSLTAADPAFNPEQFNDRVKMIFHRLNESWTELELDKARPYISEGMFDYLRYWTDAYQARGMRNMLERTSVDAIAFAKISRDRFFDAITIRIWASGLDYTVDAKSGKLLGGDRKMSRKYSEYWTLIRSSAARGPARSDGTCPNCGAGLAVGMGGSCNYCGAHVTNGEFDWVLASIEQDEAYTG
ncbi:MAG: TIM44-like domain-containing protein, partial [Nannocystaceae bacterium]